MPVMTRPADLSIFSGGWVGQGWWGLGAATNHAEYSAFPPEMKCRRCMALRSIVVTRMAWHHHIHAAGSLPSLRLPFSGVRVKVSIFTQTHVLARTVHGVACV